MTDGTEKVLQQADALIRRSRVFVAGSVAREVTRQTAEDVPVLTEVVTEREAALASAPVHMQLRLDALRDELSNWLERELPDAVLKVTDGLADQLMAELTDQAERNLLPRLIARLDGSAPDPASGD